MAMESSPFIVSARKYRPQNFDIVVGQAHITTTLKNAITNQHLAHAYLFCGPRGVGKTTCARILAKAINCENINSNAEPCNACQPCRSFQSGATFNIFELDAASNNSVEDIRHLIEQVRYAPQGGKYKVFIVDEVHMLSANAFNAFLKTLEEPPAYAVFILATTEKQKILPTILSRCQIYDFKRISNDDIEEYLHGITIKENILAEKEALTIIAQKSDGGMRDALSLFDKIASFTNNNLTYKNTIEHLDILDIDYFFQLLTAMQSQNIAQVLNLFTDIYKKGFDGDTFLEASAAFFRDLLVSKNKEAINLLDVLPTFKQQYFQLAEQLEMSFILSALHIINEAEIQFKFTRNKKLLVEMALIKITFLPQAIAFVETDPQVSTKKKITNKQSVYLRPIPYKSAFPKVVIHAEKSVVLTQDSMDSNYVMTPQQSEIKIQPTQTEKVIPIGSKITSLADVLKNAIQQTQALGNIRPLEQYELEQLVAEYILALEKKDQRYISTIFADTIFAVTDDTIRAIVSRTFNKDILVQNEIAFMDFLKQKTKRMQLKFIVEINEDVTAIKKPAYYTSQELFEQLEQTYPLIKKMKQNLMLEILL